VLYSAVGSTSGKAVKAKGNCTTALVVCATLNTFPCRSPSPPIPGMFQVAITLDYRYQPPAGAPIDAGKLVADNGKVDGYRY
jgi:hypothetical protein